MLSLLLRPRLSPMNIKLFRPLRAEWIALITALLLVVFFNVPFWERLYAIVSPLDGHGVKMLGLAFLLLTAFFSLLLQLLVWPWPWVVFCGISWQRVGVL